MTQYNEGQALLSTLPPVEETDAHLLDFGRRIDPSIDNIQSMAMAEIYYLRAEVTRLRAALEYKNRIIETNGQELENVRKHAGVPCG